MDMSQYLDAFLDESRENLQSMNECLLQIELGENVKENLRKLFRAAHTIKGAAATMNFDNMAKLTHKMEDILDLLRSDMIDVNTDIVNLLFSALDVLEEMTYYLSEGQSDEKVDFQEIYTNLHTLKSISESSSISRDSLPKQDTIDNKGNMIVTVSLREDCQLKVARGFVVLAKAKSYGDVGGTTPDLMSADVNLDDGQFSLFLDTKLSGEIIKAGLEEVSDVSNVEVTQLDEHSNQSSDGDDAAQKIIRFNTSSSLKVDISRLDHLMNLVSELMINRTRFTQLSHDLNHQELISTTDSLNRNIFEIQDLVMKIRMVPIESTFNRFPRLVRDLAQQLGKDIRLILKGRDTELDRTIIDEIGEPLLHMIRNAVDHGIETPQDRIAVGKEPQGTIQLSAYQQGDSIYIEVKDDGGGIDPKRLREKAFNKGYISSLNERIDEYQLMQLMFESGFSTAKQVSDVSGRGVGLDVVKNKIESLGGQVEVVSELGHGTQFTIVLPLTLAIISVLLVGIDEDTYAIPLNAIDKTWKISSNSLYFVQEQLSMTYRGDVVPIVELRDVLEYNRRGSNIEDLYVVIAKKRDKLIGIIVDKVYGQEEIVIKPLGRFVNEVEGITGATILGNGNIALILDTAELVLEGRQ